MKTLLSIMLLFVCSFTYATNPTTDDTKTSSIDGQYIGAKNVKIEVFSYLADNSLEKVYETKSIRYFTIPLEIGEEYLIRFSKEGKVKYLYIPKAASYDFVIDVDFTRDNSAILEYDHRKNKYVLSRVDTSKIEVDPNGKEKEYHD